MSENKNSSEQMTDILNGLTDEQKEKVKSCKDVNEPDKRNGELGTAMPDELMESVAGGLKASAQSEVLIDVIATATAECKKCHQVFEYEYHWVGGMHDGPWNHPVPDYCPKCDPNAPRDR